MEKINIAELLKDCPNGMELDCTLFEKPVKYLSGTYVITIKTSSGHIFYLTKYGHLHDTDDAKCVIFPKGKTTWKGFVPPCKFKDGDVLFVKSVYNWIIIYKESENEEKLHKYVAISDHPKSTLVYDNPISALCYKEEISKIRFATEEEKDKLFNVIKDKGYRWNEESKTLEELVGPKFHKGDWITCEELNTAKILSINVDKYEVEFIDGNKGFLHIDYVDRNFHLWTIQDAKDGDVLTINWYGGYNYWEKIIIFKKYHNKDRRVEGYGNTFKNGKLAFNEEVPFYSKTWTSNLHPANKEHCELLFQKIKEAGYRWNEETNILEELTESKFKDGDIVFSGNDLISIFKKLKPNKSLHSYVSTMHNGCVFVDGDCWTSQNLRLATEEEKEKLFKAISAEGYKWDPDTKTLLTVPIFKPGDRIKRKDSPAVHAIKMIDTDLYVFDDLRSIPICVQGDYELVPKKYDVNTLKPFDRVLVRSYDSDEWRVALWGHLKEKHDMRYDTTRGTYRRCIPYEGNEHLLGKTDNCGDYYKTW